MPTHSPTLPILLGLSTLLFAGCGSSGSSASGPSTQAGAAPLHLGQPTIYPCGGGSLVAGDFNGDGHPDFAAGGPSGDACVQLNRGDGTFDDPVHVATSASNTDPSNVQTYDANSDGRDDLFLGTTGWVYVAFGQAKQAFTTPVRLEGSSGPTLNDFFSLGDVDGDGVVDVSAQDGGQIATHYLAKGAATLRSNSYFAADLRLEFVADMNGDGRCDLVGATSTGAVGVALTQSDGTPHSVTPYHDGATTWMGEVHQADINGDGAVDVVSAADLTHLYVMFGNGDGSVGTPVVSDDGGTQFAYFRLADLDGDGALDAVCFGEPDKYQLLHGTKDGTFQPWSSNLPSSLAIYGIAVADFDADGRPDIAITNGNSTYVFLNAGP